MRSTVVLALVLVGCGGAAPSSSATPPAASAAPTTPATAAATARPSSPSSPPAPSVAASTPATAPPTPPAEWTPARYVEELRRAEKEDHAGRGQLGRLAMNSLADLAEQRDPQVKKVATALASAQFDESQKQRVGVAFATEAPGAKALDDACGAPVSAAIAKAGSAKATREALVKALAPCKLESRFGLSAADVAKVPLGCVLGAIVSLQLLSKTSKDPASEAALAKLAIWAGPDPK